MSEPQPAAEPLITEVHFKPVMRSLSVKLDDGAHVEVGFDVLSFLVDHVETVTISEDQRDLLIIYRNGELGTMPAKLLVAIASGDAE